MAEKLKQILRGNPVELLIFTFFFLLYGCTSSRSVVQGDSGDFLSAAAIGGVVHDPGYPLYALLSRIAYLLPFGHPAWQVNLLSALFGSIALVFTYKIIRAITKNTPSALFGALSLGIYQSFWFYALDAEIHVLQVMLMAVLFYFLVLFIKTKKTIYFYLCALFFGLSCVNNQSIIFTVPSFVIVYFAMRKQITLKRLFVAAAISLLGFLPYLYLFWAASHNPVVNWGRVHDLESFLAFFLRKNYGTIYLATQEPWAPFAYSPFVHFFVSIFTTSWYVLIFVAVSFVYLLRKNVYYLTFFVSAVLLGPVFYLLMGVPVRSVIHEANTDQYIAYPFFFINILAGMGLSVLMTKYKLKNTLLYSGLVVLFFTIPFFYNLPRVRQDNNKLTEITTKFQLSEIPTDSIFIAIADSPYLPAMYWQNTVGYRKDITIIAYGLFNLKWYRENLRLQHPELGALLSSDKLDYRMLCQKYAGRLYISPWYPEFDVYFKDGCRLIPYGLITKVVSKDKVPNIMELKDFNEREWNRFTKLLPPMQTFFTNYSRTAETQFRLGEHFNQLGIYYVNWKKEDWGLKQFQMARSVSPREVSSIIGESALLFRAGKAYEAISILEDGINREPATAPLYKNLAVIYQSVGQQDKAYENFKKYIDFNPTDDQEASGIVSFINGYESRRIIK